MTTISAEMFWALTTYTTIGNMRGSCGHRHRTVDAAARCVARDLAKCRVRGDCSDRIIVALEPAQVSR